MTRRFPTEAKFDYFRGRNGARDIVVCARIPHGKRTFRQIEVPIEPEEILKLADAIRCCPQRIGEMVPVGRDENDRIREGWCDYVNLGHAVWHMDNPNAVRPCLPHNGDVIDVEDSTKLPPGVVIDVDVDASEEP